MNKANSVNDYVRVLDQEPDCIAIVPTAPNFVVVGTYSLVSNSDDESSGGRKGSLQILPFLTTDIRAQHATLDRKDFPFGIYDIHFHPQQPQLLGVATSNAEIFFFRTQITTDKEGSLLSIHLKEASKIIVEEPHETDGRLAVITQFQFIDTAPMQAFQTEIEENSIPTKVLLAATTQFGNTKLLQVQVPACSAAEPAAKALVAPTLEIHKQSFDLEAWTVLPLLLPSRSSLLVLSGGDDSQLLISSIDLQAPSASNLDLDTLTPTKLFSDKRTHSAGVVSIYSLGTFHCETRTDPSHSTLPTSTLILTGSYDESLRLLLLTPPSITSPKCTFKLLRELKLPGAVWRIIMLDQYPRDSAGSVDTGFDCILLIAGHTGGVFILRLSAAPLEYEPGDAAVEETGNWHFSFKVEKIFTEHESLVYAVAARRDEEVLQKWHVISTSFYDKKFCNWEWIDTGRQSRFLEMQYSGFTLPHHKDDK